MITLQKIAELANVSIGTVDRVIHNRGRVSQDTVEKVKRIIHELDYKPNILARSLSLSRSLVLYFAVLIPKTFQDGSYWELPLTGIKNAQHELEVYNIKIDYFFYDKYSESSFSKSFDSFLIAQKKYNGLVIAPVLSSLAEQYIEKIPTKIPYVCIDSYIPQAKSLCNIGEDSFASGFLAAKLMAIMTGNCGQIITFDMYPKDNHISDRIKGFGTYLSTLDKIDLKLYKADRLNDSEVFYTLAETIVNDNKDLKGIFVPNSCVYQIARFFEDKNIQKKIFLIGYDLILNNFTHLRTGKIDFIISQRSELQGYKSIYTLFKKIALKEDVVNKLSMPLDIITKENLEFYHD